MPVGCYVVKHFGLNTYDITLYTSIYAMRAKVLWPTGHNMMSFLKYITFHKGWYNLCYESYSQKIYI